MLTSVIFLLTSSYAGLFAQSVYDDFEDGVLDPLLWTSNGPGTLTEENGRAVSRNRGHLTSVQEFDPDLFGININGSFTFLSQDFSIGIIEIVWRAEQGQSGMHGQSLRGVSLLFQNPLAILSDASGTIMDSIAFTLPIGDSVAFDIVDDAGTITAQITNITTGQSVNLSGQLPQFSAFGNYVKFYGREAPYNTTVGLDEISISETVPTATGMA